MQAPKIASNLARQVGRRNYAVSANYKPSTYNEHPSPCGSWQTQYDANQRKYNGVLALGIGTLGGTILFGKICGFFQFYNDIPDRPADIASYKLLKTGSDITENGSRKAIT